VSVFSRKPFKKNTHTQKKIASHASPQAVAAFLFVKKTNGKEICSYCKTLSFIETMIESYN